MTRKKPIILTFNKFYLPGYRAGGPIRTLANMVERLDDSFDFFIVTLNRDTGGGAPYPDVQPNCWNKVGKAQVMYFPIEQISLSGITAIVSSVLPDVIYLNSFFDPTFTQRVLWVRRMGRLGKTPVVLAPRGEFSAGALNLKQGKKRLYLKLVGLLGLYRKLSWQASSSKEKDDICQNLRFVSKSDIFIALNIAPPAVIPATSRPPRSANNPLRMCFLSRISPKKNLDFALKVLAEVRADVLFTIYGPKAVPSYWKECEGLICALPDNIQVVYEGEVHPDQVKDALIKHDMFFLPTRGENYGHVIQEALCAGLPVLISDQTPWESIEEEKVGWAFPLEKVESFVRAIESFAALDSRQVESFRNRACRYGIIKASDPAVLQANIDMFSLVSARHTS